MSPASAPIDQARMFLQSGQPERALDRLRHDLAGATTFSPAHALQLETLLGLRRRADAEAAFDEALRLPAPGADALDALAYFARLLGRHDVSNRLYRSAATAAPGDATLQFNLATSERSLGNLDNAAAACARALRIAPDDLAAVLLRSEVSRATSDANNIADLQCRLAGNPADRVQMFVAYALGKELHDLSRYDDAFVAFARGAAARRRNLRYDVATDEAKLRRIEEAFGREAPAAKRRASDRQHIFIIGLPRSGTTLTERILGALPGVTSNGETDNFSNALIAAASTGRRDIFEACADADPDDVAAGYEALAAPACGAKTAIEKLPLNYLYVGAIARALPTASLVWVRRNPVDSCFAMFRTLFGEAYPFSYDFSDVARYYAAYWRLMMHWKAILPGRIIEVDYEALVAAPSRVGADLAARCGLAWTDEALDPARNRTASLTASAAQIRQPIYASSAGLWRSYRRHLEPLARDLQARGIAIDG